MHNQLGILHYVINVNFDFPVERNLTMYRSTNFGVNEPWLVYCTKVMYTVEDFKVDNTRI